MSYTHSTTHAHPRSGTVSRALFFVGMVFIGFGLLEIIVALVAGRSAATVFADGIDNLTVDGLALLGAAWIERKLVRVLGVTSEVSRKISTVTIGVMGPVLYGASLLAWSAHKATPMSTREAIILLAVGGASFWLNKRLHTDTSDHNHAGLSAHLINDMVAAVAIVLTTTVVALDTPVSAGLTIFIGISAFNAMVWLTWKELRRDIEWLCAAVKQLAMGWLAASIAPVQAAMPISEPPPSVAPLTVSHDHTEAAFDESAQLVADLAQPSVPSPPLDPFLGALAQIYRANPVETAAAAIRNLTTILSHDSEAQMGLAAGDQTRPKVDGRLPASAIKTIIRELHVLREALVIHSPCLVMTSKGG